MFIKCLLCARRCARPWAPLGTHPGLCPPGCTLGRRAGLIRFSLIPRASSMACYIQRAALYPQFLQARTPLPLALPLDTQPTRPVQGSGRLGAWREAALASPGKSLPLPLAGPRASGSAPAGISAQSSSYPLPACRPPWPCCTLAASCPESPRLSTQASLPRLLPEPGKQGEKELGRRACPAELPAPQDI